MAQIILPPNVNIGAVISLLDYLGRINDAPDVEIDFRYSNFYSMSAVVAMIGKIFGWADRGKTANILNIEAARNYTYLQRMDFFRLGGVPCAEYFTRNDPSNRFVELKRIGRGGEVNTAEISTQIANCIAPELADEVDPSKTGFYDCIEYAVSELMNNVIQHSDGAGFVGAQHYEKTGITQIAIADDGIGIKESFFVNNSPLIKDIESHQDAISKALQSQVSSKTHLIEPWSTGAVNAGVGLTLLRSIALRSGGDFVIVSGNAALKNDKWHTLGDGCGYSGTYVAIAIKRERTDNFDDNLHSAKIEHGLMSEADEYSAMFR